MEEILDTRFFIEHFYSKDLNVRRKTGDKLRELARTGRGTVPVIVLTEVVKVTCDKRGAEDALIRHLSITRSGLHITDLTADIAKDAGLLRCKYKNVPTGDCIIAATAIKKKARLISDDEHFDIIREVKRTWL